MAHSVVRDRGVLTRLAEKVWGRDGETELGGENETETQTESE